MANNSTQTNTATPTLEKNRTRKRYKPTRIPLPEDVLKRREVLWMYAIPITLMHVFGLLAFVPWFFNWTSVIVLAISVPIYGLGITLCYHRLLAHRSLKLPKWLERLFVLFALCSMEDTPAKWVATHRLHHVHPDRQPDPHSPLVNFLWGHVGWLFSFNRRVRNISAYQKYARDLLEDRFYLMLEKTYLGVWIYVAHAILYLLVGLGIGFATAETTMGAIQFAASLFLWGVVIRTLVVWHVTWSVNSLTHLFGYQNYETKENSRNNWLVAILALGEGWHNNHHYDPAGCSVRHRWWEFDITYGVVLVLKWCGLASDIIPPKHQRLAAREQALAAKAIEKATGTSRDYHPTSSNSGSAPGDDAPDEPSDEDRAAA